MRYLKLYEQFRLILEKLNSQGKKLFLLCGPSATGKTFLANKNGIKLWTELKEFEGDCLITTDGVDGEKEKMYALAMSKGLEALAEIMKTFDDGIYLLKTYYPDVYGKWEKEASDEEKEFLKPLWEIFTEENTFCPNTNQQDSRVLKLAFIAYLWGGGRIVFDDVRPTINKFFDGINEYIIYTPLTIYLGDNIRKRMIKEGKMNVKEKITKFFEWFQLSDTVDNSFPDKTKYTLEQIEEAMKGLPVNIKDFETISKITENMKREGFYFKKGGLQGSKDPSPVFNSRGNESIDLS